MGDMPDEKFHFNNEEDIGVQIYTMLKTLVTQGTADSFLIIDLGDFLQQFATNDNDRDLY